MVCKGAGWMEELFEEGKERALSLSDSSDQLLLFCTGCIHLRLCRDSAGLNHDGDGTLTLESWSTWPVLPPLQRHVICPCFWRDYFELSHLKDCKVLPPPFFFLNKTVLFNPWIVQLSITFLHSRRAFISVSLSLLPLLPLSCNKASLNWCTLLKQSFLILRCTVILLRFHHKKGVFLVPLTM